MLEGIFEIMHFNHHRKGMGLPSLHLNVKAVRERTALVSLYICRSTYHASCT